MSDEPLTHIARTPLPWREVSKTVCGKPISQYPAHLVIALADARSAVKRLGQQRFALTHCMTCAHNVGHWATWDDNPIGRMEREVTGGAFGKREPILEAELRAFAILAERYADEFRELVEAFTSGGVTTMTDLRRMRAKRTNDGRMHPNA